MFFTRVFICLTILVLTFSVAGAAPEGEITLDHVEGNTVGNQIGAGELTFYIRYHLYSDSDYLKGFSNGFRIYSPEGATWTPPVTDSINGIADYFDLIFTLNYFSADGIGEDTVSMGGSLLWSTGLPPGFNDNVLTITTAIDPADHGKTLCIDSSYYPPTGKWTWTAGSAGSATPSWGGPYCFEINGCLGDESLPDRDNDGNPDLCDECPDDPDNDIDEDGICGDVDNCPVDYNPLQEDADGDGIGDACDDCTDTDEDGYGDSGYPNNTCADDNCPETSNPTQSDADGDGIGDVCDECTDTDGDGYGNPGYSANTCPVDNCPDIYNPEQTDSDGDGKGDDCDGCFDTDGDGYGNPGHPENTCPEDNCPDITNNNQADADGDGIGDVCDECTDTDGDGFGNPGYPANTCEEDNCPDNFNPSQSDANGNGVGDACDLGEFKIIADVRCGELPLEVNFSIVNDSNQLVEGLHTYWWYGDGGEGFGSSIARHTYNVNGVFDLKVFVITAEFSDTLYAEKLVTTQTEIGADIIAIPTRGEAPLTVVFDAHLENLANQFYWDFGDGDTSVIANPIHTYEQNGIYDVTLIASLVLDSCDQVDTVFREGLIRVGELDADFSSNLTAGTPPLSVHFFNESGGSTSNRLWDFGGLGSSIVNDPIYTFNNPGFYDISLKVWDITSDVDSVLKQNYIRVTESLYSDLRMNMSGTMPIPGSITVMQLAWMNGGSAKSENCSLKVLLPSEFDLINVYPGANTGNISPYSLIGDTILVTMDSITPSGWNGGYIGILGTMSQFVLPGDSLLVKSWISSSNSDYNLNDNYLEYYLEIGDQLYNNEKYAYPGGLNQSYEIDPRQRLNYTISFRSTVDDIEDKIYLRVVDTLSDQLDWSTLVIGEMSHPGECYGDFNPYTGVVTWVCDSINLPPNSSGYFSYSVTPKRELPEGTEILNRSWMRFDYESWLSMPYGGESLVRIIKYPPCCRGYRGNVDNDFDDILDIGDLVYFVEYSFDIPPGPEPECFEEADVNASGGLDIADIVYLVEYMFEVPPGPMPLDCP